MHLIADPGDTSPTTRSVKDSQNVGFNPVLFIVNFVQTLHFDVPNNTVCSDNLNADR